jgi:hypothetical protein
MNQVAEAVSIIAISLSSPSSFLVTTALAENLRLSNASGFDALVQAAAATVNSPQATHYAVATAASSWWEDFWSRSTISLPTQPQIEQLWLGAQYILAISSSTDPRVPAPGLFGPFVTWDVNGWNGDYTLE